MALVAAAPGYAGHEPPRAHYHLGAPTRRSSARILAVLRAICSRSASRVLAIDGSRVVLRPCPRARASSEDRMTKAKADPAKRVLAGLPGLIPTLEAVYKDIHAHPELSMQETRTAALAARHLRDSGYEV